jgi:hypothetical protein
MEHRAANSTTVPPLAAGTDEQDNVLLGDNFTT